MSNQDGTAVNMFDYNVYNYPTGTSSTANSSVQDSSELSSSFDKTNDSGVSSGVVNPGNIECRKKGKCLACWSDKQRVKEVVCVISGWMVLVFFVGLLGFLMPFGIILDAQEKTFRYNSQFSAAGVCTVASTHVEQQVCKGYTCFAKVVTFNYTTIPTTNNVELIWVVAKTYDSSQSIAEQNLQAQWPVGTIINPCYYYYDSYYGMQIRKSLTLPYSNEAITYAWVSLGIGLFLITVSVSFWIFAFFKYNADCCN